MFERMIETAVEKALNHRISELEKLIQVEFQKDLTFRISELEKSKEAEVQKALDRRTVQSDMYLILEDYNPLPDIMRQLFSWVLIPFKGKEILVEVRYPRSTQLPDVEKFSHLRGVQKKNAELSHQQMIEIMSFQEECCRAVLNRPTFEEFEHAIYDKNNTHESRRKQLEEIRKEIRFAGEQEKLELQAEFNKAELFTSYVLPHDTMLCLTNIALGVDILEIKKITKEKLLAAYNRATLNKGRPSDYVQGIFTEGDRKDIDDYAAQLSREEKTI